MQENRPVTRAQAAAAAAALGLDARADASSHPLQAACKQSQHSDGSQVLPWMHPRLGSPANRPAKLARCSNLVRCSVVTQDAVALFAGSAGRQQKGQISLLRPDQQGTAASSPARSRKGELFLLEINRLYVWWCRSGCRGSSTCPCNTQLRGLQADAGSRPTQAASAPAEAVRMH